MKKTLVIALVAALVFAASCRDEPATLPTTNTLCDDCHGQNGESAPPLDVGGNSATNFTGVGAHREHLGASAWHATIACDECHIVPALVGAPGHVDGSLPAEVIFGAVADSDGVTSSWNGTTCSTYCHGTTLDGGNDPIPVWTTVDGTQKQCDSCHGNPPGAPHTTSTDCSACHGAVVDADDVTFKNAALHIDGSLSVTGCASCHGTPGVNDAPPVDLDGNVATTFTGVGAHQAHLGSAMSNPVACVECHVAVISGGEPAHIDGDDTAELTFGALADSDSVTSAWNGTTCTTYCHGASLNGGGVAAPNWTVVDGTQDDCDDCHGNPPPAPHPANSDCSACHGAVVNADDVTFANVSLHVDGTVQTALNCTSCHGTSGLSDAPPADTSGNSATTFRGVGAHQEHLGTGMMTPLTCNSCHVPVGATDYTHSNSTQDMSFTGVGVGTAWNGTTCSNSYCHGDTATVNGGGVTTPNWTTVDGTQDDCDDCHGNPPPAPHPANSDCSACHGAVVNADDVTFANAALHINGVEDVSISACNVCHGSVTNDAPPVDTAGLSATTNKSVGSHQTHLGTAIMATPACDTCHTAVGATDYGHSNGVVNMLGGIGWDDVSACSSSYCHGDTLIGGGATPSWVNVGAGGADCGTCHDLQPGGSHPVNSDCNACHDTVINADNTTFANAALHIDGNKDTSISACNVCHGSVTSDAPPQDTSGNVATTARGVGAHETHLNTAIMAAINCDACHVAVGATDYGHSDGTVDVNLAAGWDDVDSCSSSYCHDGARDGATPTPDWTLVDGTQNECDDCHGNPPTTSGHPANSDCSSCHGDVVAADDISFAAPARHIDGIVDVSGCNSCHGDAGDYTPFRDTLGSTTFTDVGVGGHQGHLGTGITTSVSCATCHVVPADLAHVDTVPAELNFTGLGSVTSYDQSFNTCSNTYCHGDTLTGGTDTAPDWTSADGNPLGCGLCHGNPPPAPHVGNSDCSKCHDTVMNADDTTFAAPSLHIDGTVQYAALTCATCHGSVTNDAPPTDTSGGSDTTDKSVGSHQTHLGTGIMTAPTCDSCHAAVGATQYDHANGTVNVLGGIGWNGASTCSNSYCHGDTLIGSGATPSWIAVGAGGADCGTCHDLQPGGSHPVNSDCDACHDATVNADNVTFADTSLHINGVKDYLISACNVCHGSVTSDAPPQDTSGNVATTARGVGAHETHLTTSIMAAIDCDACHDPVGATAYGHSDGAVDMNPAAGWDDADTCSSSYCHDGARDGDTPTPDWTLVDGSQNACDDCHGNPPTSNGHTSVTDCSSCHDEVMNDDDVTFKNPALHIDGTVQGGESNGGLDCSACHADIWNGVTGVGKTSRHTLGNVVGTNDSSDHTSPNATWTGPLSNVAAANRSCANMCHSDHPHGGPPHTDSVHEDATDSTSRSGASVATDFSNAATNGGMCVSCHRNPINSGDPVIDKADYNVSAHNYAGNDLPAYGAWTYTQHDGAVFNRNCTKCHADNNDAQQDSTTAFGAAHFSDYPTILSGSTNPSGAPGTFVCYNCHGNGSTGSDRSGQDLATDMVKAVAHPVNADADHDAAAELTVAYNDGTFSGANRHTNCLDCHNQHVARSGAHNYSATATSTRNDVSNPLTGVSGLQFNYGGLGNFATTGSGNFTWVPAATGAPKEYQVCFKCHTSFAWGGSPPNGISPNGSATNPVMTNLAQEFNPGNASYHPVVATLNAGTGNGSVKALRAGHLKAPWNTNPGNQTMKCIDCHNTDAASPAAQGPHGSAAQFMLRGANTRWPGTNNLSEAEYNNTFCVNCHQYRDPTSGGDPNEAHRRHQGESPTRCYSCHIMIPHGGGLGRLLGDRNGSMPSRYAYGNDKTNMQITGFTKRTSQGYGESDCGAQCDSSRHNLTNGSDW